jgi:hypothetical protein
MGIHIEHAFANCVAACKSRDFGWKLTEVCRDPEREDIVLVALARADWLHNWNDVLVCHDPHVHLHLRRVRIIPANHPHV